MLHEARGSDLEKVTNGGIKISIPNISTVGKGMIFYLS
jgi:hypothetical protein